VVDVLVLGDELLPAGLPRDGGVRDALGPQAPGWVRSAGSLLGVVSRLPDESTPTADALASCQGNLVLTTGGTARGPVDQLHPALERLSATIVLDQVAVRPGHPMVLAVLPEGRVVVGLPGNPLAAAVAFISLAVPALLGARGLPLPAMLRATTQQALTAPPTAHRLVPSVVTVVDGALVLTSVHHHGPAMLRGLAIATHLAVVPPSGVSEGDTVEVLGLPWAA
jgi:molybdopterin molybdotransferase